MAHEVWVKVVLDHHQEIANGGAPGGIKFHVFHPIHPRLDDKVVRPGVVRVTHCQQQHHKRRRQMLEMTTEAEDLNDHEQ